DEGGLAAALEFLPGAERRRVAHAIDEELAEEMIDFVLKGSGRQAACDEIDVPPLAVPRAHAYLDVAEYFAPQVRHAEAPLVVAEELVADGLEHRVDENRERDVRLVRIARVVVHLDGADLHGPVHL